MSKYDNRSVAPKRVKTRKAKGELAEIRFLEKTASLGYVACKPFGDNARFDFLVEARGRLSRVQVKSGWTKKLWGSYWVRVGGSGFLTGPHLYTKDEIDFIAAYAAAIETWYIIPVEAVVTKHQIRLGTPTGKYENFRERWDLLERGATPRRLRKIWAMAEELSTIHFRPRRSILHSEIGPLPLQ